MAGQALGVVPPAQAFGADAARVEGVPGVTAATAPEVFARGVHPQSGQRMPLSPAPESAVWTSGAVSGRCFTTDEMRFMQVRPLELSGMITEIPSTSAGS